MRITKAPAAQWFLWVLFAAVGAAYLWPEPGTWLDGLGLDGGFTSTWGVRRLIIVVLTIASSLPLIFYHAAQLITDTIVVEFVRRAPAPVVPAPSAVQASAAAEPALK